MTDIIDDAGPWPLTEEQRKKLHEWWERSHPEAVVEDNRPIEHVAIDALCAIAQGADVDRAMLPCDPENACATTGRCWTHSEWENE